MATATMRLSLDAAPIQVAVAELEFYLPELPQCVVDRLVSLVKGGEGLVRVDVDRDPTAAGDLAIVAYPSDGLRMLLAAFRAGNLDLDIVEKAFGHENSPSLGGETAPSVAQAGGGDLSASPACVRPATAKRRAR